MDNAFVINEVLGISIPGIVESERRIVCPLFQQLWYWCCRAIGPFLAG